MYKMCIVYQIEQKRTSSRKSSNDLNGGNIFFYLFSYFINTSHSSSEKFLALLIEPRFRLPMSSITLLNIINFSFSRKKTVALLPFSFENWTHANFTSNLTSFRPYSILLVPCSYRSTQWSPIFHCKHFT